jgi:hypothetical protein
MTAPELRSGLEEPAGGGLREAPDARIAAIVAGGRATRRRPSRGAWIAAAVVGAICAIGFVLLLAVEGQPEERAGALEPARASARGGATGCLGGLGLGLGLGVAIGFGLARRQPGDHSSRSRP